MPGFGNPPRVPIKIPRAEPAGFAGSEASREGLGTRPGFPSRSTWDIEQDALAVDHRGIGFQRARRRPLQHLTVQIEEPCVARTLDLLAVGGVVEIAELVRAFRLECMRRVFAVPDEQELLAANTRDHGAADSLELRSLRQRNGDPAFAARERGPGPC